MRPKTGDRIDLAGEVVDQPSAVGSGPRGRGRRQPPYLVRWGTATLRRCSRVPERC